MNEARKKKLVGPVIAIRTFRTDDGNLNLDKQQRRLRWMIDRGIIVPTPPTRWKTPTSPPPCATKASACTMIASFSSAGILPAGGFAAPSPTRAFGSGWPQSPAPSRPRRLSVWTI